MDGLGPPGVERYRALRLGLPDPLTRRRLVERFVAEDALDVPEAVCELVARNQQGNVRELEAIILRLAATACWTVTHSVNGVPSRSSLNCWEPTPGPVCSCVDCPTRRSLGGTVSWHDTLAMASVRPGLERKLVWIWPSSGSGEQAR